jgi:hypothetical protein
MTSPPGSGFPAKAAARLPFYGIHLIAVLADCGYDTVEASRFTGPRGAPERWTARLSGPDLPPSAIELDCRATETAFRIGVVEDGVQTWIVSCRDPFDGLPADGGADRRIPALARLLVSFGAPDAPFRALYDQINRLWAQCAL